MAKTERKAAAAPSEKLLPLPEAVLKHHGSTLFPCMEQWRVQKNVPPVLLLTGPRGIGKRSVAYFLSQWLLCSKTGFAPAAPSSTGSSEADSGGTDLFGGGLFGAQEPSQEAAPASDLFGGKAAEAAQSSTEPCGECIHCQRALNDNWVDFTEISSDDNEDGSSNIKIEQFRKLKASLGFSAFDGAFKIHLIRNAEQMTVQAANSLLKILEEPPPGWIFFLTATDSSLLLPTLVSRCQTLRLKPFAAVTLRELLAEAGVSPERQAICADIAQGSWSKAIELAEDEIWERRSKIFRFIERPQNELNEILTWASSEPSQFDRLLDHLEHITADLIRWTLDPQADHWSNQDWKKTLRTHAEAARKKWGSIEAARDYWMRIQERLYRAREEATAPLNRKLLIQEVLLPWLEI